MLYALLDDLRKQYDLNPSQTVLEAIQRVEREIFAVTKEEMIDEIVQYSGGAFNMHVPDGFEELPQSQQDEIMNEVYKEVDHCACCGWVWWMDYMDVREGELWCNECIEYEEE